MNTRKGLSFLAGLIVAAGLLYLGELFFDQKVRRGERINKTVLPSADYLKSKFPHGIYPDIPAPVALEKRYPHHFILEKDADHKFTPGPQKISHKFTRGNGEVVWNIDMNFDSFKRRVVPANKKNAKNFLALFGDSNILGFGLDDESTLANLLSQRLPETNVYSYSGSGVFPYEILGKALKIDREIEIPEKEGVALLFFMSYHLGRNMGSINELGKPWNHDKHLVDVDEAGKFVIKGKFRDENPVWFYLAQILDRSAFMKYMRWDLVPSEKDFEIQTALIRKMRKHLSGLGIKKFYVVIHPSMYRPRIVEKLVAHLEKEKIPYIHFGHWNLEELVEGPWHLVYDSHMSRKANSILADGLLKALD